MDKFSALKKMLHYCNYQERCKREIFDKMKSMELSDDDKNFIVDFLQEEGFINDERYCRTYVKSKLNLKKWGVNKIKLSLILKGIDKDIIDNVLSEIDEASYKDELINLLKNKKIDDTDPYKRKAKLVRYAVSKGYSLSLVMEVYETISRDASM